MAKTTGRYVDGYVIVVPKKNLAAYKKMAAQGSRAWMKHGAVNYKECVIEDARPAHVVRTFGKLLACKPTDTVVFAYVEFKSRAHRDQVNARVMREFEKKYAGKQETPMPFDMDRFSSAGFSVIA